nr:MAG TPA: hypothetical protein [Bacteriophage sp.]
MTIRRTNRIEIDTDKPFEFEGLNWSNSTG